MPTDGTGEFSPEALARAGHYWASRREYRERVAQLRADRAERRANAREFGRDYAAGIAELRAQYQAQRAAIREDPAYRLYQRWGHRISESTLYDAAAWRAGNRLVPVTQRTRYQGGARRPVIDWTDILDREAQSAGHNVLDLPRVFDRFDKQNRELADVAREIQNRRSTLQQYRREALAA